MRSPNARTIVSVPSARETSPRPSLSGAPHSTLIVTGLGRLGVILGNSTRSTPFA